MAKFLDQKLVTDFAKFRALKNKIEKWLESVKKDFQEKFDEGYLCTTKGPFLLVVEPGAGRVNWPSEFLKYLEDGFRAAGKSDGEALELAITKIAEIESQAERKPTRSIATKPNPAFRGKAAAVLVKKLDSESARGF